MGFMASGYGLALRGFAAGLKPDQVMAVSAWSEDHRIIPPEAGAYPGAWRNDMAPYLTEIMDCLSPSHPCETVTFMKSAQVGGTEIATNWLGYIVDVAPGATLVVHPTVEAGKDWAAEKLAPTIEVTPRLRKKVRETKSRDGAGSTGKYKRFPGGYLRITGANSAAGLRQKSIRYVVKDDWDEWPLDVDGQGDPDKMVDARQTAFHASGMAKAFQVSTPTIEGLSRIEAAYEASDQRRFFVPCPDCGHEQVLGWANLKFEAEKPHRARYACAGCGVLIDHHHKRAMLGKGRWIASHPGPGRQPGFAINALYSPFTTWDKMVEAFLKAKDQPLKLKTWVNLWLGESWKERGEAPDWQRLLTRREPYRLGTVPNGGLVLTAGVDVQKDYLVYEVVAWGVGKTSWSVDFGVITGDTAGLECWAKLSEVLDRRYPDAFGNIRIIEMMAVDAGYNTQHVYGWGRGRPRVMLVKGESRLGHLAPPLGTPGKIDVSYKGKKLKGGVLLWPVGGWPLKAEAYANLRKAGPRDGAEVFEIGYCHFCDSHDEGFFKQLTAEHLVEKMRLGKPVREWVAKGPNHQLDARVYAMAAAEHLGLSRLSAEDWRALAARRAVPDSVVQPDLLTLMQAGIGGTAPKPSAPAGAAAAPATTETRPAAPVAPSRARKRPSGGYLSGGGLRH